MRTLREGTLTSNPHPRSRLPHPLPRGVAEPCFVAPSPELRDRLHQELSELRDSTDSLVSQQVVLAPKPRALGLDDGVVIPPEEFPAGTPASTIRMAAADRAPLRGTVRVVVVLVEFSDKAMTATANHFQDLFFSTGVLPHGSVKEFYAEATNGLVDISGNVIGPLQMPQTLAWYANGNFGIGRPSGTTRARDLARDAAVASDPQVDFDPYDNDGNGYVDAFIVVHAGSGGEETGDGNDIWSHKWTLPSVYAADNTHIYGYLTIPEDAKIGVCAHELGHLLFGFPDLYDTDDTSEGIGNWCLMAGGSWNGSGDLPAHPSAWCKVNQGWVSVTNVTTSGPLTIPDVKTSRNVFRLWKDGAGGAEYFLAENRQKTGFDADLPGDGLLIWHVDENQSGNTDENHYKVGLVQADNKRDMELKHNRGDAGDPYPGSANNTNFSPSSSPSSKSYTGQDTCVSLTGISASGGTMTATASVQCGKSFSKDLKDARKDGKEIRKDLKDARKETKDRLKEFFREQKGIVKDLKERAKEIRERRPRDDWWRRQWAQGESAEEQAPSTLESLEARVAALEEAIGGAAPAEPFIGGELRPDLVGGPEYDVQQGDLTERMAAGDPAAKREFDTAPPA